MYTYDCPYNVSKTLDIYHTLIGQCTGARDGSAGIVLTTYRLIVTPQLIPYSTSHTPAIDTRKAYYPRKTSENAIGQW